MGSDFRDNGWFSKLSYLGMKLACLAIGQIPEVAHILSFPQGVKIEFILTLRAEVSEILADFQKLSYFGMNSRSCTYALFLLQRVEIKLIFALRAAVSEIRTIFKIATFGHETWQVAKVPEVAHIHSFYPKGSKLSFFLSMGSGFRDTGQVSKLPFWGMTLGKWPKLYGWAPIFQSVLLHGQTFSSCRPFWHNGPLFKKTKKIKIKISKILKIQTELLWELST